MAEIPSRVDSKFVLVMFILGLIIGYSLGLKPESPPYEVRLGRDLAIEVVQKSGSYIYQFGRMDDGTYELISTNKPLKNKKK